MIAAASAVFGALADFARSTAGRRILGGVAAVVVIVGGGLLARAHWIAVGVDREKAAEAERLRNARPAIARVEAGGRSITAATDQQAAQRQAEIRADTKILKEEVPVYVTVEADRRCDVSAGFVSLHDQAAAGVPQVPRPAGLILDAPSGVALSAVADTVVDNYGTAQQYREAALACRAWAREQADLWSKNIRTAPASP
jgi:hypothetical protein